MSAGGRQLASRRCPPHTSEGVERSFWLLARQRGRATRATSGRAALAAALPAAAAAKRPSLGSARPLHAATSNPRMNPVLFGPTAQRLSRELGAGRGWAGRGRVRLDLCAHGVCSAASTHPPDALCPRPPPCFPHHAATPSRRCPLRLQRRSGRALPGLGGGHRRGGSPGAPRRRGGDEHVRARLLNAAGRTRQLHARSAHPFGGVALSRSSDMLGRACVGAARVWRLVSMRPSRGGQLAVVAFHPSCRLCFPEILTAWPCAPLV